MRKETVVLLIFLILLASACTNTGKPFQAQPEKQKAEANVLVIYHWWTSAGEAAAISSLVSGFSKANSDIAILPAPVYSQSQDFHDKVLKPMVFNNEAPDSFQGHPGYEIKPYYDSGTILTVDDIWASENLEAVIPKVIQDINKYKGNYYSVPIGVHRSNIVWYNKQLLDKNGIDPSTLKEWDSFFKACDKLKANGVEYPIALSESWTQLLVFENIIASIGPEFYEDWVNGKVTSETDSRVLQALEIYKKFLSYTNTDSTTLGWNAAVNSVIKGESAFNVMGDWANGEYKVVGMKYNVDYGSFPFPGTNNEYVLTVDVFVRPKGAAHSENSVKWLKFVASKEGQDAFNPKKGSISARMDSDVSLYDDYQKSAIADFKSVKYVLPSRGHSQPDSYVKGMGTIMAQFYSDKDVTKAAKSLAELTKSLSSDYTTTWSLT
jgi:glucose/mannose transport system substrate-binding protein